MATLNQNVAKVVAAHGALKTAIAGKGVTVPAGTKLSDMAALVNSIYSEPNFNSISFYNQSGMSTIPEGPIVINWSRVIPYYTFYNCSSLRSPKIPEGFGMNSATVEGCFYGCSFLSTLTLPDGFGYSAASVSYCFRNCTSMKTLNLPSTKRFGMVASLANLCFYGCTNLETITGSIGLTVSFDLSSCTKLTHDSLMNVIDGLRTVTSKRTLTLGSANLAKLTDDEKAVATAKGWTLA